MSDMFSPPKPQKQSVSSPPLASPIHIWGFRSNSATTESDEKCCGESARAEDCSSGHSASSHIVKLGVKRARDGAGDRHMQHSAPDYYVSGDSVSSIINRAKRLRISDHTTYDSGRAGCQLQIKPIEIREDNTLSLECRVSVNPSFMGLPDELVLEIIFHLDVFDIAGPLRKTNQRLSLITRARVVWIYHLSSLLNQVKLPKSTATYFDSLLSTSAIEHIVKRPHSFAHKWFYSRNHQQNPSSQAISVLQNPHEHFRIPILLPGGRWLIVVHYIALQPSQPLNSVCLWDLEHGKLERLPEAHMEAAGTVFWMDVKMDKTGAFAFMAILTMKMNVAMTTVYKVDIYQIRFSPDSFGFFHIDSLSLNQRRAYDVQIYPEYGHVLVDLFDRVLIWEYSPMNKCAWIITSRHRHRLQHFRHHSAHAITRTHDLLLVADGDESSLRGYNLPPLLSRPVQLSSLVLYMHDPNFEQPLPHFIMSLRFSTSRLVDISSLLEAQTSALKQLALSSDVTPNGPAFDQQQAETNFTTTAEGTKLQHVETSGRGVLFVDAAASGSYIFCSYPLGEILPYPGSPKALMWTSVSREDVHEQTRRGAQETGSSAVVKQTSMTRPFNTTLPPFVCVKRSRCIGGTLWIGDIDHISPSLFQRDGEVKRRPRTVVLMRNPQNSGGLLILSTIGPPQVDAMELAAGQTVMDEVDQGEARTVLERASRKYQGGQQVWISEGSVDSISGRVCIIEMTSVDSSASGPTTNHACILRVLEYA